MPAIRHPLALVSLVLAFVAPGVAMAQDYVTFKSPTGNILCGMFDDDYPGVRCDMFELTPSYTRPPAGCEHDWGSSFWIGSGARKGELACVSDAIADPRQTRVLPYGASVSFGGVTCRSEKTGVTCVNPAGHGFTIRKARQQLF